MFMIVQNMKQGNLLERFFLAQNIVFQNFGTKVKLELVYSFH